jgi:hypothetical protein
MICPMENGDHTELLAFSAGKLQEARSGEIREHLETCSACLEFVAGQGEVWRALDAWEPPAVTGDFDRRLYGRIEQEVRWWDRYVHALGPLLVRQWLPIAAAACLIVVAGLVSRQPADVPPPAQAAQVESLQPEQVDHVLDDMQMLGDFTKAARSDAGEL